MATKKDEIEVLSPEVVEEINRKIETSLVKENVTEKVIAQLQEYKELKINGQEDKEGFFAVQEARKSAKTLRVLAEKICKKGRETANAISKAWIAKQNEVTGQISEVEDFLQEMEDAYIAEKDRLKAERQAKIERQGIKRVEDMVKFGASLVGSNWVLEGVEFEAALVKEADDDIYVTIYEAFKAVFDEKEKVRLDKEEKERKDREDFQRQQDELKKQQQEMKDMRTEGRVALLQSLSMGAVLVGNNEAFSYGNVVVWLRDVEESDPKQWESVLADAKEGIKKSKEEEEKHRVKILKQQEDEKRWRGRLDQLKDVTWNGNGAYPKWNKDKHIFTYQELIDLVNEEFYSRRDAHNAEVEELAEQARKKAEDQRKKDLENSRLEGFGKSRRGMLDGVKCHFDENDLALGSLTEEAWDTLYKGAKEVYDKEQKRIADEAETARRELLGEKQRYAEIVAAFKAIPIGDFRSGQYAGKVNAIKSFVDGLK